jgi:CHAT domain-containing protein/tetratricopeptide (TPR) repeat protein
VRYAFRVVTFLLILIQPFPIFTQSLAEERFAEAYSAYRRGDRAANERLLEAAVAAAVLEQNPRIEGEARAYLGEILNQRGQYLAAEKHLKTALALFEQLNNNPSRAASINTMLGSNAWAQGNKPDSRRYFEQALSIYTALNDQSAMAGAHYSLSFFSDRDDHIRRGLELARTSGDRKTEAMLLHSWADDEYAADGFDLAFERLNQARSILETLRDQEALARVLTSLGRLFRVHGHADQAIPFYEQARELQLKAGDKQGVIQSLNAIGSSFNVLGRSSEALGTYEEALRLAKETGSPVMIRFILDGLGSTYSNLRQYQKAADLLEQSKSMPTRAGSTFALLSSVRFKLRQYDAAFAAANEGLLMDGAEEQLRDLHSLKAQALWKLGKPSEALADIRSATDSVEKARRTLIPTDFMKQGFSDTDRDLTTLAVNVLLDSNQPQQALATAEQARSRAFLDLVAAKGLMPDATATIPLLLTRGGGNDLPSPAAANPGSDVDLVALARRLDSTVLAYWVGADSTNIWTVSPAGQIAGVRVDSGTNALSNWIDEALRSGQPPTRRRGAKTVELTSRAGDTILTNRANESAWKRLYNVLIRPVRANLPSKGNGRLTIIPSGPLFRLSFAALMDEKGRYLLEDYSLHYAPSAGVLKYTLQTKSRFQETPRRYVFVSNPSGMPLTEDGKRLAALPGSDDEVRRISKLFASETVSTFRAAAADETSVRAAIESANVIHLATHGIVSNDDPFASYLALGRVADGSADGRLSAEEVYRLDLQADLVVLSACRSGLGRISGDGVAGLARAFFYAGAASVVATLWDVADAPASQLVSDFYQSLGSELQNDKSQALRNAQLRLLRALRRGELQVDTPFGKLPLPEDPVLWAGFVLMGEP